MQEKLENVYLTSFFSSHNQKFVKNVSYLLFFISKSEIDGSLDNLREITFLTIQLVLTFIAI